MQIVINPRYEHLREFILALPQQFDALVDAEVLHSGRNDVRSIWVGDVRLVVKRFTRLSSVNRLVYGFLRASKSMRAYKYAIRLRQLGFDSPEPVAALDWYQRGVLRHSFFVSLYSDYESLEVIDNYPEQDLTPLLDAVTDFFLRLHDAGVEHNDLNMRNVLYRECEQGQFAFQLIDINRMRFRSCMSRRQRLANLRLLSCKQAPYLYIIGRYAELMQQDVSMFQMTGVIMRIWAEVKRRYKNKIKSKLKGR